jgi:hypothetical protein
MKAARVLRFGPPRVIINDDVPWPEPADGRLLVRVNAAGAGNWDALIREGRIKLQPLPLILGSEHQESSKRLERKCRNSRLVTRYTGRQMSNSAAHTQNMRFLAPE